MEIRKMKYSAYKNDGFFQLPAKNYNAEDKTIDVIIPDEMIEAEKIGKTIRFDEKNGFEVSGNHYIHEFGKITFWNSGEKWNAIITTSDGRYTDKTVPMKGYFAKGYAYKMLLNI